MILLSMCVLTAVLALFLESAMRGGPPPGSAQDQAPARPLRAVQRVAASEIGKSVEIVGTLGLPLGEVLTIRGEWSMHDLSGRRLSMKETWLMFIVFTINGKELEKPVEFREFLVSRIDSLAVEEAKPAVGEIWEMRGVELGRYHGVPPEAVTELYPGHRMRPAGRVNFGYGFYTDFRYISRRVVRTVGKPTTPIGEKPTYARKMVPQGRARAALANRSVSAPVVPSCPSS